MGYKKHGKHLTLIPFALRKADEQLVDVSKVQKGKECGCVCPSCHAPLIARKGEINQWHFAHALRGFEGNKVEQCEYSFYLSVALMAKQLFQKCDSIRLPDYIHAHSVYSCIFWARGYFVSTVGRDEKVIREYIRHQEAGDRRVDQLNLM